MYTKTAALHARCALAAAAVACALLTGIAVADQGNVVVGIPVSGQGLDLNDPAGARELYLPIDLKPQIQSGAAPGASPLGCSQAACCRLATRFAGPYCLS